MLFDYNSYRHSCAQ